jgi:GNAT superfamily N-acetyltransferase
MFRFERVRPSGSESVRRDWLDIHNLIIPTAPLTEDEVAERAGRHHLEVAYLDEVAVGCSTVRPPADGEEAAVVIARVRPEHRRRGFGAAIYARGLAQARELGARVIETVVLESNDDGLRFAGRHGFEEVERYVLPGDSIAFVDLRLTA